MGRLSDRRLWAFVAAAAASAVLALWPACGIDSAPSGEGGGSAGAGGAVDATGDDGAEEAAGEASGDHAGDVLVDVPPPYDGAVPCAWEGWYVAPRMPPGCDGLCIADDPSVRVPWLEWKPKPEWCSGCQVFEGTWWPDPPSGKQPLSGGVTGTGAGPDSVILGLHMPDGSGVTALFEATGAPAAAWRTTYEEICGRKSGPRFSHDGRVAVHYISALGQDQQVVLRPVAKAGELPTATDTTFTWPEELIGMRAPNDWEFSRDLVVADMLGNGAVGEVASGKALFVETLPGILPGQYGKFSVFGDAAWIGRYDYEKYDWWLYRAGKITPFLGGPDVNVDDLVTDGEWIVWSEGKDPYYNDAGYLHWGRFDLFRAAFTTDPTKMKRELLLEDVHPTLFVLRLDNGYVSATHGALRVGASPAVALVVRVADGHAWRFALPEDFSLGKYTFTSPTDLWVGAGPGITALGDAAVILRIPYDAMETIQAALPGG